MSLPTGLADAVVAWSSLHLPSLLEQPLEAAFDDLGRVEARWRDLAVAADEHERTAAACSVVLLTDALWDLWARTNDCPLWKLIVNLAPEHLIRSLDLRAVEDVLSPAEARQLLETRVRGRSAREADLRREGYPVVPAVTLGQPDALQRLESMSNAGWPLLRVEVPTEADATTTTTTTNTNTAETDLAEVLGGLRRAVGRGCRLVVGPQQPWFPLRANSSAAMLPLVGDLPLDALIEPVDPLDVTALAALRKRLGSAPGRRVELGGGDRLSQLNSVKQLLAAQAVDVCRVDPGRLGVSASLVVLLLAARLRTPVCVSAATTPVGSTAGLSIALHLAAVDNIAIGASLDRRWVDLGTSADLLAAVLNSTPGRCRLPVSSGSHARHEPAIEEKPLSNIGHR